MISSELRLVIMDVLYRNENRMRLADFEKAIALRDQIKKLNERLGGATTVSS